jgi:hypothetical protein
MPCPRLCVRGRTVVVGAAAAAGGIVDGVVVEAGVVVEVVDAVRVDSSALDDPPVAYDQYPSVAAAAAPANTKCRRVNSGSLLSSW